MTTDSALTSAKPPVYVTCLKCGASSPLSPGELRQKQLDRRCPSCRASGKKFWKPS
jgi:DNA-directed RNA polymerase subunit RPC12/RpoP